MLHRFRREGIVLSVTEAAEVFRAMSDAANDAAGHTAGDIRHDKKRDGGPDEWVTVARDEGSRPSVVRSDAAARRSIGP